MLMFKIPLSCLLFQSRVEKQKIPVLDLKIIQTFSEPLEVFDGDREQIIQI